MNTDNDDELHDDVELHDDDYRPWIIDRARNDRDALIAFIKEMFNCLEVDVDEEGNVWIAKPQKGHWLGDEGLTRVGAACYAGRI